MINEGKNKYKKLISDVRVLDNKLAYTNKARAIHMQERMCVRSSFRGPRAYFEIMMMINCGISLMMR